MRLRTRLFILITALVAGAGTARADGPSYAGTDGALRVAIPRLEASAEIDGDLADPVWQQAARLTGFSQYSPDDGRPAEDETEVLVWYSPSAIYFGIRAHAALGSVRATLADRDHIENDDWVQIYLATFNDGRRASVFGVNPLGVQMDGAVIDGSQQGNGGGFGGLASGREATDLSPDFVFESKGRLTEYGYEVELRIPFKSLRYQPTDSQDWGIHIVRRIQSTGHEDSWVPARRSAASFLGQAGTLEDLTALHRGLVMDLNPVVTARADGAGGGDGWTYDGHRPEFGGNVRWGLTPNLTLNATVNPDFSQVEADATQFQFDPRQALFFEEKRPFFLDGIEFFSTPNNLIYSRRIADPIAAAKLTGKIAGTTIAAMSAVDASSQSVDGSHPVFNIVRVQRDMGGSSRAALVYTDRIDGPRSNRVAGADAHLVWRRIYAADLQTAFSRTAGPNAGPVTAPLWRAQVSRSGRRYGLRYTVNAVSPDFVAASGFISRPGIVNATFTNQISLYGATGALFEKWTGDVSVNGIWRYDDFLHGRDALERKLHLNNNFFLRGGWHSGVSVLFERFDYDDQLYANYALYDARADRLLPFVGTPYLKNLDYVLSLDTPRVHGVSGHLSFIWGRDENFFEWSGADIVYSTVELQWRPTQRLRVDLTHNLQSFARRTDGSYVGIRRIPRVKVEYQATRAIFFRYVGEYSTRFQDTLRDDSRTNLPIVYVAADGSYTPADAIRERTFRNDWLFSYQPTPGTVFFAGYSASLANPSEQRYRDLRRTQDGFFLKVSYLFRM